MGTPAIHRTGGSAFDFRVVHHHDALQGTSDSEPRPPQPSTRSTRAPAQDRGQSLMLSFKVSHHDAPPVTGGSGPSASTHSEDTPATNVNAREALEDKAVLDDTSPSPERECDGPRRTTAGKPLRQISLPFPVEILHQIGSCGVLAPADLVRLSKASKDLHNVFTDDYVWHALAVRTRLVPSLSLSLQEASDHADVVPCPKTWFAFVVFLEMVEWQFGWNILGEPIRPWHIEQRVVGYSGPNQRAQLCYTPPDVWGLDPSAKDLFAFHFTAEDTSYCYSHRQMPSGLLNVVLQDLRSGKQLWKNSLGNNPTVPAQVFVVEVAKSPRWFVCLHRWQTQDSTFVEQYVARIFKVSPEGTEPSHWRNIVVYQGSIDQEWDDERGQLDIWRPAIVGDQILVADAKRIIHTYDLETGEEVRSFSFAHHLRPTKEPLDYIDIQVGADGDVVFIIAGAGRLIAVDPRTGDTLWDFDDMLAHPDLYGLARDRIGTFVLSPSTPLDPIPSLLQYQFDTWFDIAPLKFALDPFTETLVVYTTSDRSADSQVWILKNYKSIVRREPRGSAWVGGIWKVPEQSNSLWFGAVRNGRLFQPFLVPGWSFVVFGTALDGTYPVYRDVPRHLREDRGRYTRTTPYTLPWDEISRWGMLCPLMLDWRHANSPPEIKVLALPAGPIDQGSKRVLFPGRVDIDGHPSLDPIGYDEAMGYMDSQRMPPFLSTRCAWLLIPPQQNYLEDASAPDVTTNMRWDWSQAATEWLLAQM